MSGTIPQSGPSVTSSNQLPFKESLKWLHMVTDPRCIRLKEPEACDAEALPNFQKSLAVYKEPKSDVKDHNLVIIFDSEDLAEDVLYYTRKRVREATLENKVYRKYFLLSGHPDNAPSKGRTVHLFIQPDLEYLYTLASPPPYAPEPLNRRDSAHFALTQIWDVSHSPMLKDKDRKGSHFYPDHVYACRASEEHRDREDFKIMRNLPGFRVGKDWECDDLILIHALEESKADKDGYTAAMQYMLFVSGILLHERLLLRSLAEDTLKHQQFRLEDSHRIFFVTCCGDITTIHEMRLRDIWTCGQLHYKGWPVSYDAIVLAELDMTKIADCERLKKWLNAIHTWGITVHYDSVLEDGIAAARRQSQNTKRMNLRDLHKRAFTYGSKPGYIKYVTWDYNTDDTGIVSDDKTSKWKGAVKAQKTDILNKTTQAAKVHKPKKKGKKRFSQLSDIQIYEEPITAQARRSERLKREPARENIHTGVSLG